MEFLCAFFSLPNFIASDSDAIADQPKSKTDAAATSACTFGKLTLNLGDQLKTAKSCVTCACSVAPMLHCVQQGSC